MKSIRAHCWVAGLVGLATAAQAVPLPQFKAGELLFKVKDGHETTATTIALASIGQVELERYPEVGWVRVRFNPNRTIAQATTAL